MWHRVWEEMKYQWHPFSWNYVSHYDIEDEVRIPGYWKKGKFLKDKGFWLGSVLLLGLWWLICH